MTTFIGVNIALVVAILVGLDASKRGMNVWGWGIGVFLLLIVFLPLYFILRKPVVSTFEGPKANLINGLIMGLIGIVFSLVIYFLDLTTNKWVGYSLYLIEIIVLFFLVKSYRENYMHGMITYGQAMGAGVVIFVYCAIIMADFTYILYAVIDPGLLNKLLALSEEESLKRGYSQEQIDMGMKITRKIMTAPVMTILSIFGNMFVGTILSLIVAAFVRKEGNPLVDSTQQ
jgi:hypothetical protein